MSRRFRILDHGALVIAREHAKRVYRGFVRATQSAIRVQQQVLHARLRANADSDFGRDHHFDRVRSTQDFRRHVPVLTYDDHRPYIERVKSGDLRALFGPGQRVHMFALTSGTTDEPKFIPVTGQFLRDYRRGWNAFGIKALLDHPHAFLRPIVQVTSRMDESRTEAGIPCGAITGLMAATQKRLVRKYYVTPQCVAEIDDAAAKYYTIMRLGLACDDAAFVATASPATQLKLARTADTHRDQLIRDVHDGTLRADLAVPDHVRRALAPRLAPAPQRARYLERIVAEHDALLPKHYWDLAFVANWTGGTMGLYLQDFPHYFGDVPVRDVGLLASEGRVSIPIDDGTPAGILDVMSHFFEFIPRSDAEADPPPTFLCHELEVGEEYFVVMTTASGLYRYQLGDLVRVVGYFNEAPLIEFLNKGAHVSSLAGEKLTEHQVILAMQRVAGATERAPANFLLAPRWSDPPHYVLHAEAHAVEPALGDTLAVEFDRQLAQVNLEYASRRSSDRLGPIRLNLLPPDALARRDHQQAERHRRGNEQFKHRYLYCRPGEDADLERATATRP